nr:hypothetical protein [Tanacetum cinerariifolium]
MKEGKIKHELEEIETINIKLDHRVTKLIAENEHLKQTYKQLYDSIKSSCIRSKEQCDDIIKQVNIKKAVVDEAVILHPTNPELLKIDVAPLAPKLRNNRTTHYDYLKHTQEETATLKEIVKHERSLNLLNTSIDYACYDPLALVGRVTPVEDNIEIGELRAISDHVLGAARVQILENNLDNLHSTIEEDGILETVDPHNLLGLDVLLSRRIGFLRGILVVVVILVKGHTFPTIVKVLPVGLILKGLGQKTDKRGRHHVSYGQGV